MHSVDAVRKNVAISGVPISAEDRQIYGGFQDRRVGYHCPFENVDVALC
jgi:hypothetical protein